MKPLFDLVAKLGPARLAAMGAVTLTLVGFFAFVMLRVSQPAMGVLFSDLSMQDATAVLRELDARGVRYETRGEGGQTVLAPRADLARLRMDLATKGMPSAGGVGYEIFDKGDAFSSTNFVQTVNHLRALEGELARSIRSIGRVQAARVHLVMPERRLFARDQEAPSASIVVKVAGDLDPGQVLAIRHLVASAVGGLKPEKVSLVDERGRLLADGAQPEDARSGVTFDERQTGIERRLRSQVEEIVAGIVGQGRARVQVAAELDVNRVESRQESFDPESRVVRSTQTRTEASSTAGQDGTVSVGNELPGANGGEKPSSRDNSNKNEETTNYEISRLTKTEVVESGRLKRISVAVLVDGAYARGANGQQSYQPRPKEELDRIAALVRTAVGFDKARGDQVEVVNLRFAEPPTQAELPEESLMGSLIAKPSREDVLRLVELVVLSILTLVVLMSVVRPLVKRVLKADPILGPAALAGPGGAFAAAGIAGAAGAIAPPEEQRESGAARLMEFAKINGQIQAQTVERVTEMVRGNPTETVEVLRNWIHDT